MRTAVVDIGSNTTRLYIADVQDGRITHELERRTKVTRLGAGVDRDGRLADEAMQRVYDTLDDLQGVDRRAQRRASRRRADKRHARRRQRRGVRRHGARSLRPAAARAQGRGGGSALVPRCDERSRSELDGANARDRHRRRLDRARHRPRPRGRVLRLDAGRRRAPNRAAPPFGPADARRTRRGLRRCARRSSPPPSRRSDAAPSSTRLPSPARRRHSPRSPRSSIRTTRTKVHGYVLESGDRDALRDRLAAMTLEERRTVKGLDPARAPTIVAGVLILTEVMNLFGIDRVEVSEHDILRGAALGL